MNPTITVRDLLREYALRRAPIDAGLKGPTLKACLRTIHKNRLANLLLLNDQTEAMINSYREAIWSTNSTALLTILHVLPVLENNQINYCIIKGPPLLKELYDDYFFRPATDVDILVQLFDFDRAAKHLREASFALRPACKS